MSYSPTQHLGPVRSQARWYIRSFLEKYDPTPRRVASMYLMLGFCALFISDVLLVQYVEQPRLNRLQAIKGAVEVILTAGFIYVLTRGSRVPLEIETERLRRQREELQVLHRIIRHNLRNNLNAIKGHSQLLYTQPGNAEREEWYNSITNCVDDLISYTEKANKVEKIPEGETMGIDLAETIPQTVNNNEHITDAVSVDVNIPNRADIHANHMFDVAVDELLTNAVIHSESDSPAVTITVNPNPSSHPMMTEIIVEDDGPGFPENTLEVLNKQVEDPLSHMDGLGLWMVYWIVNESNGEMRIETGDSGSKVIITLPSVMDFPPERLSEDFKARFSFFR